MHQVAIAEGQALRGVLGAVLEDYPNHREAAKALDIGQTTFTRLLNGTINKRIGAATYESIRGSLRYRIRDPVLEAAFVSSVLQKEGQLVLAQYKRWREQSLKRLLPKTGAIFRALFSHPDYGPLFQRFMKEAYRRSELPVAEETRLWMALYRVIEPLADAKETWGMERSWQELHDAGELGRFLQAGLDRERILLHREREFERLNRCTPPARRDESAPDVTDDEEWPHPEDFWPEEPPPEPRAPTPLPPGVRPPPGALKAPRVKGQPRG